MATTPRIPLPPGAEPNTTALLDAHAPELRSARDAFFAPLADAATSAPVVAELLRLQVAESTGCTLCRNMRKRDAVEAGVDEDRVAAMRAGRFDEFEQDTHAALELGRRFCTDPESSPGVDADVAARGADAVATEVLTLMKATAFGKVVVMLGVEPEDTSVRVVA